jgi:uncharacterized Ntn-hydrolase superfamily protein
MLQAFNSSRGKHLAERLIHALGIGAEGGGEEGPVRSAGVIVADRISWPVVDLRVDWHEDPIRELSQLWSMWQPQHEDYVVRAVDPARAPTFEVSGSRAEAGGE